MTAHLRIFSPWSQLGLFLGLFGAAFVFTGLILSVVLLSRGISPTALDFSDPGTVGTMKLMQGLSSITIFLAPALIFAFLVFRGNPLQELGLRPVKDASFYLLALGLILLGFPLVFFLGEINQSLPIPDWLSRLDSNVEEQLAAFLKADSIGILLFNLLIIAVLPAVCEEICFRGALQGILIRIFANAWSGIIASAVLFSALHFQFEGFLPRFYLGIVLGIMYWFSGSLWPAIFAHFVHNGVQVVFVANAPEYVKENPSMPLWMGLASALIVAFLCWLYVKKSKTARLQPEISDRQQHGDFRDIKRES